MVSFIGMEPDFSQTAVGSGQDGDRDLKLPHVKNGEHPFETSYCDNVPLERVTGHAESTGLGVLSQQSRLHRFVGH